MRLSMKRLLERAACRRSSRVRCAAVRSRMRCLSVAFSVLSRPVASLSCSCWVSRSWPRSSPMRARWARISAWAVLSACSAFSAHCCQDASAWASRSAVSCCRWPLARVMAVLIRSRADGLS